MQIGVSFEMVWDLYTELLTDNNISIDDTFNTIYNSGFKVDMNLFDYIRLLNKNKLNKLYYLLNELKNKNNAIQ